MLTALLVMTGIALVLGAVLGFVIAVARRYGPRPIDWLLRVYVEVIRGTPFLVQAYLLYFGGPYLCLALGTSSVCLTLDPFEAGLLGLAGLRRTGTTMFGGVGDVAAAKAASWLDRVRDLGRRAD